MDFKRISEDGTQDREKEADESKSTQIERKLGDRTWFINVIKLSSSSSVR